MKKIFVDTSFWYTLTDKRDPYHKEAVLVFQNNKYPIITSNYVFAETITLMRSKLGFQKTIEFGKALFQSEIIEFIYINKDLENEGWRIFEKYYEHPLSFIDATSIAIMKNLQIKDVFSLDTDFLKLSFNIFPKIRK